MRNLLMSKKYTCFNLSVTALILLTIYNILITVKVMNTPSSCPTVKPKIVTLKPRIKTVYKNCEQDGHTASNRLDSGINELANLNLDLGRYDDQLKYRIFDNIIVGDRYAELNEIYETCLATQSSLDKLASIIEVSLHWGGPISLAVFASKERELNMLLWYILYLRRCYDHIKEKITFHLVIPNEKTAQSFKIDEEKLSVIECDNPAKLLRDLLKEIGNDKAKAPGRVSLVEYLLQQPGMLRSKPYSSWSTRAAYPQNHLRNVARKNCHTKFVFLTDVDVIPSKEMAEKLNDFLIQEECDSGSKCAYVVPTYEIHEKLAFPPNKTDLIRLANKGLARPFHQKVFIYNQYATNFSRRSYVISWSFRDGLGTTEALFAVNVLGQRCMDMNQPLWQQYKDDTESIRISHPVTNFEFLYEPFYISTDNVPPHDERFIGYGYTRNTQVYEMFVAGYQFYVLSPIFTCHWGLQVKRTRPPWREHQNSVNRKQFDKFKKEIFAKYNKDPLNMMSPKKVR